MAKNKRFYVGDGLALTKREYIRSMNRFYRLVIRKKVHKTGQVY